MLSSIEIIREYGYARAALDTLGFLFMLFGIYCLYVLTWAVIG